MHVDDLLCTALREDLRWLQKQLLKEYALETMLMGEDDDMEKKAVYLGGVRLDRRHVRSLLRELGNGKLSMYLHATECHSGEGRSSE